jgi:2-keto-4-pentenoate hydratase/2-oxohepta-3-ene-1,7-dioic acid hydratase in catechol pathway
MKIICIGRNYARHIEELKNEKPKQPVIFLKPDTALLKNNSPFFYPGFSKEIHYEVELLIRINKEGKSIEPSFAEKYYNQIGLGIDFTARDLQADLKSKGLPWELAKGFNGSAVISEFVDIKNSQSIQNLNFQLSVNGKVKQLGNTSQMLYPVNELISFVSKFFTLRTGDIIFTGTPEGVGPIIIGDRLEGFLEGQKMFDFEIK